MKWWRIDHTYRNLTRTRRILAVFVKYGFGGMLEHLNLVSPLRRRKGAGGVPEARLTAGERLRLAFEELGPTFVKLGQLLSTRPDLLPGDVHQQMQKLQDQVPPALFEDVRKAVEKELGAPLGELFARFEEVPTASASVAQVHKAVLTGGETVAVKVVRPGISGLIEADMEILSAMVGLLERRSSDLAAFRPHEVLDEFNRYIMRELDLTYEAYAMMKFGENFRDDPDLLIPRVYWERSGRCVLTMQWVEGIPLSRAERLRDAGFDFQKLAEKGANGILRQVFEFGLFHGDPHPGNVLVLPDGRLALLDYGIVGRLSDTFRDLLGDLLQGLVGPDPDLVARAVLDLSVGEGDINLLSLREDVADFIGSYYGIPLKHLPAQRVLGDGFAILRRHGIAIPPQLSLLVKVLVQTDGVGRSLHPDFSIVEFARPFVMKMVAGKMSPSRLLHEGGKILGEGRRLLRRMPGDLSEILRKLRGGRLKMELEHTGLSRLLREMDRVSNRLSFAIIIAALIVGSSLILQIDKGPHFLGLPLFGLFGFVIAGGLGLWLVVDILRTGHY